MSKRTTLDVLQDLLVKARKRVSDDYEPELDGEFDVNSMREQGEEPDDETLTDYEFDPDAPEEDEEMPEDEDVDFDADDDDEASKYLRAMDPKVAAREEAKKKLKQKKAEPAKAAAPVEAPPAAPKKSAGPMIRRSAAAAAPVAPPAEAIPVEEVSEAPAASGGAPGEGDDFQPSLEELVEMRGYTRPWEHRQRGMSDLQAEAHLNPHKHRVGRMIEAAHVTHGDKDAAYREFTSSPDYQAATRVGKMKMVAQWQKEWKEKNPDHLKQALQHHHEAHKKGSAAKDMFLRAKDEKMRAALGEANGSSSMSMDEGIQHVGGERGEDGEMPDVTLGRDAGASFAGGNREFVQQAYEKYNKKAQKFDPNASTEMEPEERLDPSTLLNHPALKDPQKAAKVNAFYSKFQPLIEQAAHRTVKKMGLQDAGVDHGMLHEAGMHALFQAINDYDHNHTSKASFKTHFSRKMQGLMQVALKSLDEIPQELRAGAKKFDQLKRDQAAAPVKHWKKDETGNLVQQTLDPVTRQPMTQPPASLAPKSPAAPAPVEPPKPAAPPVPAAKPTAPVVRKRASHEIAAAHHPDIQDRLKRVSAAKAPTQKKWNIHNINVDEE